MDGRQTDDNSNPFLSSLAMVFNHDYDDGYMIHHDRSVCLNSWLNRDAGLVNVMNGVTHNPISSTAARLIHGRAAGWLLVSDIPTLDLIRICPSTNERSTVLPL